MHIQHKITPKTFILSLLQASGNHAMPINTMVAAGAVFGIRENAIRVTATRLTREGILKKSRRGVYRLGTGAIRASQYIERWRDGENRIKKWDGSWLCGLLPNINMQNFKASRKAFGFFGFKEGLPNFWVRPNNLNMDIETLGNLLSQFGKMQNGEMFTARKFNKEMIDKWQNHLWPVEKRVDDQKKFLSTLTQSAERIEKMPMEAALVESFIMGSEAIRLLITDPLLPPEMMDITYRKKLHAAMLDYDTVGKRIWSGRFDHIGIDKSPAQRYLPEIGL